MRKPVMHSIWLVLVLSVLGSSASAGQLGDLTYEIADGEVIITDCRGSAEGELVIPAEIEGLPVTSTGRWAFYGCSNLTSITLPEGVTSIDNEVFSACTSLTSINIPEGVTSIEWSAFFECYKLTSISVTSGNASYKSIDGVVFSKDDKDLLVCPTGKSGHYTIPEGVTSIGWSAFSSCSSLTSITIPQAFHSEDEASRLGLDKLWPNDFSLPDSAGN